MRGVSEEGRPVAKFTFENFFGDITCSVSGGIIDHENLKILRSARDDSIARAIYVSQFTVTKMTAFCLIVCHRVLILTAPLAWST